MPSQGEGSIDGMPPSGHRSVSRKITEALPEAPIEGKSPLSDHTPHLLGPPGLQLTPRGDADDR
jgi:hypothetical protein